jgi:hypothetical protein
MLFNFIKFLSSSIAIVSCSLVNSANLKINMIYKTEPVSQTEGAPEFQSTFVLDGTHLVHQCICYPTVVIMSYSL